MTYDPRYGQPYGQPDNGWPTPAPGSPAYPVSGFPGADPVSAMPASPPPLGYPGGPPAGPPGGPVAKQVVPRPPRPMIVFAATVLTLVGAAVAFADVFVSYFMITSSRDSLREWSEQAGQSTADIESMTEFFNLVGGVTTIVSGVIYLLAAGGVIACAVLALRGSNGARITQVVLVGVYGVSIFCCRGYGIAQFWAFGSVLNSPEYQSNGRAPLELPMGLVWTSTALNTVLFLLSATIFVLLLLPAANQYFSPGPGRQFAARNPGG